MTEYRTIIADPPWTPALNAGSPSHKAGPQRQYKTLGVPEIISLRPPAAKQAHLWLWVLTQHVDWGYLVARTWGFEPWTMLTWCKPDLGVGRFQCNTEHVLLCRKGTRHGNPFGSTGGTWFTWPRGQRHSAKPEEFYRLVESASPGPYLEMFARTRRPGWDAFGDEVEESICLAR
jgi:N6-adenosine-specific RNA methylase IME4